MKFCVLRTLLGAWLIVGSWGLVAPAQAQEPGKSVALALAEALQDRQAAPDVRLAAARTLLRLPAEQAAEAVGALTAALADPVYAVRESAALALAKLGQRAEPAIPALTRLLTDRDEAVKSAAVAGLSAIGPKAKEALPAVLALAKNQSAPQRPAALAALGAFGQADAAVLEVLLAGLDDTPEVVQTATAALARLGAPAVEPLLQLLQTSPKQAVRERTAAALAKIGEPAVAALLAQLAAPSDTGRADAQRHLLAQTLAKIGKPALTGLTAAAKDAAHPGQLLAVEALGWVGADAAEALLGLSNQPQLPPAVLQRTIAALAVAGVGNQAVGQRLLQLVESEDVRLRREAVAALGATKTTEAVSKLAELAKADTQPLPVRLAAVRSLGQLGESAKEALPTLRELASSKGDNALREYAVVALAGLGGAEVEAILLPLTRDPDNGVRRAAIEGLAPR
jgi:HEAT repeat protein